MQTLSHSCSMSPQAGKGWDLFLLYGWGARAQRMDGQREEAVLPSACWGLSTVGNIPASPAAAQGRGLH